MGDFSQFVPGKTKYNFKCMEDISRHLLCCVCHDVFDDPQRLSCGHTFCCVCILAWAAVSRICPICKDKMDRKLEKDRIAAAIIDDLPVRCIYMGCKWEGAHSLVLKHQRFCQFRGRKLQHLKPTNSEDIQLTQQLKQTSIIQIQDSQNPVIEIVDKDHENSLDLTLIDS